MHQSLFRNGRGELDTGAIMMLDSVYGFALILIGGGMVWIARPAKGADCAPFLRAWIAGQAYALVAMICTVMGMTYLISGWPG